MKIGLSSYSMVNRIYSGEMDIIQVMELEAFILIQKFMLDQ